jgi:hypothetical protein
VAVSRQRCSESERDSGPVVPCARVAAALLAVLALHVLVSDLGHATRLHVATPWILIAVALGGGVMLREAGRGLAQRLPRPRWSPSFVGAWAGSSGLLLTVLLASGGSLGSGASTSIAVAVAVGVGLVLAASLQGVRRLLCSMAPLRDPIHVRCRASPALMACALTLFAKVPAPLLAGWSDRGPPPRVS